MLAPVDTADLDNGPRTIKSATERMCVVTRSVRPIDELIRFVVAPTGEAIPDLKRKLPGRGLWVSASHKAVAEAAKRNLFSKGFKKPVKAQPTLADDTDKMMVRGVIEALAITAKASQVVSGFTKVEDALRRRQAKVLLHASDGAVDGIRKLDGIARQSALQDQEDRESLLSDAAEDQAEDALDDEFDDVSEDSSADSSDKAQRPAVRHLPIITVLTSDELDLALGRSNVIHAALLAGPASKTFLSRSQTLVRYRMADDGTAGVGGKARTTAKQLVTEPLGAGTLETSKLDPETSAAGALATANPPATQDFTE
jgi:predicted RNA-binding protein YlxR (DUF448 family)